jgi:hypothetical protein
MKAVPPDLGCININRRLYSQRRDSAVAAKSCVGREDTSGLTCETAGSFEPLRQALVDFCIPGMLGYSRWSLVYDERRRTELRKKPSM